MSKVTPAVNLMMDFDCPNPKATTKKYGGYVSYIDREDAKDKKEQPLQLSEMNQVEGVFHSYMDYMKDEMKNGQLFSAEEDVIVVERLEEVRELYTQAEEKGSPLWKDVLSFDNEWLEEQGLYKSETHWLNEKKLKEVVRVAMNKMIEEEKMHDPIWTASFHYNTDNIHVHIATVELDPSHLPLVHGQDKKTKELLFDDQGEPILQRRGWRKDKTRMAVRSSVANQIVDRSKAYKRIDELIRDTATKTKTIDLTEVQDVSQLFERALQSLPKELNQWYYGYQTINEVRPYIDEIANIYLSTHHSEELEELHLQLNEQVALSERLYGSDSRFDSYKQNKLDDLRERMGNAVLHTMRTVEKERRAVVYTSNRERKQQLQPSIHQLLSHDQRHKMQVRQAVFQLNQVMRKSFHDYQKERNQQEFDRMLEGYEYE